MATGNIKTAQAIEHWPLDRLVPYERNARTHSPEQVAQITASIQEFGFTNPILVADDDGIIAGHGRLHAARELSMKTVPVVVLDHLNPEQRRAYVLADNKLALNAGWDDAVLVSELQALQSDDFDLSLLGWSDDELAELLTEDSAPLTGSSGSDDAPSAKLADRFGIPPFTVLNAREGWWQDRKRQWLALGIQSELGRGGGISDGDAQRPTAAPGGSMRPACDYSKSKARGDGAGRAVA
jgi:ParB-like chromosome segregation protein Spo0J